MLGNIDPKQLNAAHYETIIFAVLF